MPAALRVGSLQMAGRDNSAYSNTPATEGVSAATPDASVVSPVAAARRAAVDHAREDWIKRLIDPSRRNNLLYYRSLKTGTHELTDPDPTARQARFAGETVILRRL